MYSTQHERNERRQTVETNEHFKLNRRNNKRATQGLVSIISTDNDRDNTSRTRWKNRQAGKQTSKQWIQHVSKQTFTLLHTIDFAFLLVLKFISEHVNQKASSLKLRGGYHNESLRHVVDSKYVYSHAPMVTRARSIFWVSPMSIRRIVQGSNAPRLVALIWDTCTHSCWGGLQPSCTGGYDGSSNQINTPSFPAFRVGVPGFIPRTRHGCIRGSVGTSRRRRNLLPCHLRCGRSAQ